MFKKILPKKTKGKSPGKDTVGDENDDLTHTGRVNNTGQRKENSNANHSTPTDDEIRELTQNPTTQILFSHPPLWNKAVVFAEDQQNADSLRLYEIYKGFQADKNSNQDDWISFNKDLNELLTQSSQDSFNTSAAKLKNLDQAVKAEPFDLGKAQRYYKALLDDVNRDICNNIIPPFLDTLNKPSKKPGRS
ncbi:MAG: hypothetical protein H0W64_05465 [Gammaproteobacteria bacterium]|nr:hypothetical protein [Gammaproteobacteria bacterium]